MNVRLKWIGAVVFCIAFAGIVLPRLLHNRYLPEKLHGVWQTTETKYTNRYFLLDKNAIGFGAEDGKVDWYEITRVDETVEGNKILYTIEFQQVEGAVIKKYLYYDSKNGGRIRFKNQLNIEWVLVDG